MIRQRGRGDVERAALLAPIGEIKSYAIPQGLEKLVKGVPRREAAGELPNVGLVAAVLDVNTRS
jgi:hypothetical protein